MNLVKPSPSFLMEMRRKANKNLQRAREELGEARDFWEGWPDSEVAQEWVSAAEDDLERAMAVAEEWM